MLTRRLGIGGALRSLWRERDATAAIEFALTAPIMILMILATFDLARASIAWEELSTAAGDIAQAAEKLSYNSSSPTATSLTGAQMTEAMSVIYADMPGLNQGKGGGSFPGAFAVTLSGVVFLNKTTNALCTTATGCGTLQAYTLWTAALLATSSGSGSSSTSTSPIFSAPRDCASNPLTLVTNFPDDSTQLKTMVGATFATAQVESADGSTSVATSLAIPPQVVADVQYTYTPLTTLFLTPITFRASATFPAPISGLDQEITYNSDNDGTGASITSCTLPASTS